jgi:hypothetical protein
MIASAGFRRRRTEALVLGLVVAVGVGGVMTAWAGARRAETSFDRFRSAARDAHAFVGVEEAPDRLSEIERLDGVEESARFGFVPIHHVGADDEAQVEGGGFASIDGTWLYEVQRPRVLTGDLPVPASSDTVIVNEAFARAAQTSVGDVVVMEAATSDGEATVTVELRVAAVVRTVLDIGANAGAPVAYLPPGFLRAHPEVLVVQGFSALRLDGGDDAAPAFADRLREVMADEPSLTVAVLADEGRYVDQAISVQAIALRVAATVMAWPPRRSSCR